MTRSHLWCAALLVPVAARAQQASCTRAQPVRHSAGMIAAYLEPIYPTVGLPPEYVSGVLTAIRSSFHPLDSLNYATFVYLDHDSATLTLSTTAEFEITRDGAVEHVRLIGSSLSKAFDDAVAGAIARADSDRLILPPPNVKDRAYLRLTTDASDGAPRTGQDRGAWGPLFPLPLPIWASSSGVHKVPRAKRLEYPLTGRQAVKSDSVLARFVVDESGAVVQSATYIEHATWRDFALSVLTYLKDMRYQPGTVGGCPATMMVRAPFTYLMSSY